MSNILIVDDNVDIVELMADYVKAQGHSVSTAYNGPDAIAMVKESIPDLILLDIEMPGMNGIEVCQKLRSMQATQLIPIVIITGKVGDATLLEATKAGCDDFLSKPPDIPVLQAKINTLLRLTRLRNQLREKEKFEYMIDNMTDGLIITDTEGSINTCNSTAARVFALDINELSPKPFFQIIDETYQRTPLGFDEIIANKHGEFIVYRRGDGFKLGYALNVTYDAIINPFSDVEEIVFVCNENTDRINEEYRKDLLVTMMRHKFNTLDAITQVNLDALKFLIDSPDPGMETKIIDGLKESSNRMTTTVRSVLDFLNLPENIDQKQSELITALRLNKIINKIEENLGLMGIKIDVQWKQITSFEMVEGGLYRILYELVENAFKFGDRTDLGLKVSVELERDQELRISVFNRGEMILPEELNRIWDRFYQFDPHLTGQIEGIGLGLSTVKYIVELAGGSTNVSSTEVGTTFSLTFPTEKVNPKVGSRQQH